MVAADTIEDIERLLPRVVKLWRFLRVFLFDAGHGSGGEEVLYFACGPIMGPCGRMDMSYSYAYSPTRCIAPPFSPSGGASLG